MHKPTPLATVLADARWLAHRYDPGHDAFHFRFVPLDRHDAVPFLTDECLGIIDQPLILKRTDAMAAAPSPGPIHFIFHSAYCCSTLLAAAFSIPGLSMGLKEPVLLNDMIGWRHHGAKASTIALVIDETLTLLARPFSKDGTIVVKPSNIVNPLIPAILTMRPDAKALLLHAPLEAYLASIARKSMWGRLWVRDLFGKLIREGMISPLGITPDQYLGLTDIQVAAVGWLAQQLQFKTIAERFSDRIMTLNSDVLIAQPAETMSALATAFGLALDTHSIRSIVEGPVFSKDAKLGTSFVPGQRATQAQQGKALYAEEIDMVRQWAERIAEQAGIPMALPTPLLG